MSPLEFYKTVLEKVSFDHELFTKEYGKAIEELPVVDRFLLEQWCLKRFHAEIDLEA